MSKTITTHSIAGSQQWDDETGKPLFVFNGNYKDSSQVEEFLPEFERIYNEIIAKTGRNFAYNDDFIDRISGIANKEKTGPNTGSHEDAAIFLLQRLRRQREQDAKVEQLLAEGFEHIESVEIEERFKRVIFYSPDLSRFAGEWVEWRNARLVPYHRELAVIPYRKRTRGHPANGRKALALR